MCITKKADRKSLHIEQNSEHIETTWILRWLGICIVLVKFRKSISLLRRSKLLCYTKHIKWMSASQLNLLHRQLISCWLTLNLKRTLFLHYALLYIAKLSKKRWNLTARNSFYVWQYHQQFKCRLSNMMFHTNICTYLYFSIWRFRRMSEWSFYAIFYSSLVRNEILYSIRHSLLN